MRGVITREVLRQVVAGTYFQLWWPAFDTPVYMSIGCPCGPASNTSTATLVRYCPPGIPLELAG